MILINPFDRLTHPQKALFDERLKLLSFAFCHFQFNNFVHDRYLCLEF